MSENTKEVSATGRRKNAAARVWLNEGTGRIVVNDKEAMAHFCRPTLMMQIEQPLIAAGMKGKVDIRVSAKGGGLSGQAGAVRHGIARALIRFNTELRSVLKKGGFLTRDAREKERKKYGRPGARKRYQFSKR
jgi:small subunit ribosomal protein S9